MAALHPLDASHWTKAHARHLLNRAGFGIPQEMVQRLYDLGPEGAVDLLVNYPPAVPADQPSFVLGAGYYAEIRREMRALPEAERQSRRREMQREERESVLQLQGWWFEKMLHTGRPLEEKMTLFWHGHFATSAQKVKSSYHTYALNQLFRSNATGNFKALTLAVGQSPSMLNYLDNAKSTEAHPNENWARELMELFTLGQGQYTEDDIKEAARAFTGWSHDNREFTYRLENHDAGRKTFMGRTGILDGWDVLDTVFEQPAASTFIAGKLWSFFVYEQPEPEIVQALGEELRAAQFELRPMLRSLFLSEAFYSARATGTQVKSPAQFVVQLCEDLGLEKIPYAALPKLAATLGQNLFYPPNVKGWPGNRAWINANTLLQRYNIPPRLALASMSAERGETMMMSGGEPMMQEGDAKMAQAKPAMKGDPEMMKKTVDERRKLVQEKLRGLPPGEQQIIRQKLRAAKGPERREILRGLGIAEPGGQAAPMELFRELNFKNGGECVAALEQRFLVSPLVGEQRSVLLAALGATAQEAPLTLQEISLDHRRAALHLITSMAEYQLC